MPLNAPLSRSPAIPAPVRWMISRHAVRRIHIARREHVVDFVARKLPGDILEPLALERSGAGAPAAVNGTRRRSSAPERCDGKKQPSRSFATEQLMAEVPGIDDQQLVRHPRIHPRCRAPALVPGLHAPHALVHHVHRHAKRRRRMARARTRSSAVPGERAVAPCPRVVGERARGSPPPSPQRSDERSAPRAGVAGCEPARDEAVVEAIVQIEEASRIPVTLWQTRRGERSASGHDRLRSRGQASRARSTGSNSRRRRTIALS